MKNYIPIIFLLLVCQSTNAQNFELGGEIGYGKAIFNDDFNPKELFGKYSTNNLRMGIIGTVNPGNNVLFINTGLIFQQKGDKSSLDYFKIPLGLDIEPGNKFRGIIGGGLYFSYLFMMSGLANPEIKETKNDFQVGSYVNIGFKYRIVADWNILLKMQLGFDLSTLYKSPIPSHFGIMTYEYIRSYDYSVNLGFTYVIHKKKKK